MKKIFLILHILLIVVLSACSNVPPAAAPIGLTPNPSAPADDAIYTTKCATIYPTVPDDVKLPGSAVLDDYKFTSHLFLKNLQNGSEVALATPNDTVSDIRVSPDKKSVSYQLGNPKTIEWSVIVADAQGQRKSELIWSQGFFFLGKWISNESILILSAPPFVVLNPYTQQTVGFEFTDSQATPTTPIAIVLLNSIRQWTGLPTRTPMIRSLFTTFRTKKCSPKWTTARTPA